MHGAAACCHQGYGLACATDEIGVPGNNAAALVGRSA